MDLIIFGFIFEKILRTFIFGFRAYSVYKFTLRLFFDVLILLVTKNNLLIFNSIFHKLLVVFDVAHNCTFFFGSFIVYFKYPKQIRFKLMNLIIPLNLSFKDLQ